MVRKCIVLLLLCCTTGAASLYAGEYAVHLYQPSAPGRKSTIPDQLLKARLVSMIKRNGFRDAARGERFILTPLVQVMSRDTQPGTPISIRLRLAVTICIGDGVEGKKFSSVKLQVSGTGNNELKAFVEAYRQLDPADTTVKAMFQKARQGINAYYTKQCDSLLKQAGELSARSQHEQALLVLLRVPEGCEGCSRKAMDATLPVYKKYVDAEALQLLTAAKKTWVTDQGSAGAESALKSLSGISPQASCYGDAKTYFNEITAYFTGAGKQAPDYKMQEALPGMLPETARREKLLELTERCYTLENAAIAYKTNGW